MNDVLNIVSIKPPYFLPQNVRALSGIQAIWMKDVSHSLLGFYGLYGYEYTLPAVWEFDDLHFSSKIDDSLSTKTIKVVDQYTARTMSFRADNTLQTLRMHGGNHQSFPKRVCYGNQVFLSTSGSLHKTRHPFQLGAEIFGLPLQACLLEIFELALHSFLKLGLSGPCITLNHTAFLDELCNVLGFQSEQRKNFMTQVLHCNYDLQKNFNSVLPHTLFSKHSDIDIFFRILLSQRITVDDLEALMTVFHTHEALCSLLQEIKFTLLKLQKHFSDHVFVVSFSDMVRHSYHNGIVFSIYHPRFALPIIRGGSYLFSKTSDENKHADVFSGCGFSLDLFEVIDYCTTPAKNTAPLEKKVFLPFKFVDTLKNNAKQLRKEGVVVVAGLSAEDTPTQHNCTHVLEYQNGSVELVLASSSHE